MNTVEKVKFICKERKIPISKLERDLNFSNGYIGQLKKGTLPNDRLVAISNYLNIPCEELLKTSTILSKQDERDIAKDLENIMNKLNSQDAGPASFDGNDIPEDDRELFATQLEAMLTRLKKINKELYNPNKNKK